MLPPSLFLLRWLFYVYFSRTHMFKLLEVDPLLSPTQEKLDEQDEN